MAENTKALFDKKYLSHLIWPLVFEQFLAMTIGACDTIMVSSIGEAGVSGVSLIDQLGQLVLQLFAAFATGGAVVASQYIGHKEEDMARRSAKQLLYICAGLGALIIAICLPLRRQIIGGIFGNVGKETLTNALTYFSWILFSFPLLGIYNCCAALCRSMGNSRLSLRVSLVMNILNLGGNAALIYGFKMGVAGAGISTLVSRAFAAVIMVIILCQKKWPVHFENLLKFEVDFSIIGKIFAVGVPSGIENSVFHIGKTLVYSFMAGFGVTAVAANAISNSVASFANIPGNAIGLASVTLIGQCIGAGEKGQAKQYGWFLMILSTLGMLTTGVVVFIFAPQIVQVFKLSPEVLDLSVGIIRCCMVCNFVFWSSSFTMPNILRGAGDAKYTMFWSMVSMWSFRVFGSWILSQWLLKNFPNRPELALYGVWIGMFIDWAFRGIMYNARFFGNRWLEKKVI